MILRMTKAHTNSSIRIISKEMKRYHSLKDNDVGLVYLRRKMTNDARAISTQSILPDYRYKFL